VITLYYKHYKHQLIDITTLIARISQTLDTVERHKTILDKKLLRVEEEEFFEQVQLAQVTELINDGIGILNLLADIEPYVVETGIAGHLSSIRLAIVKTDVEALMQLFVKDYCFQSCSDLEVDKIIDNIKTVSPSDHVKIAYFLGWDVASEAAIHDIIAKPRGYRFLKQVANIPPATADKVVETFSDLISLSKATEEALKEVEGIGEKRAKLILKGVQQMRNRKNYL
jgi:diadenylate cyclase